MAELKNNISLKLVKILFSASMEAVLEKNKLSNIQFYA
jgi:hypothetical protein